MKHLLTSTALLAVAACTAPATVCDRASVPWDKWGTAALPVECDAPVAATPEDNRHGPRDPDRGPERDQPTPDPDPEPEHPNPDPEPDPDHPSDKPDRPDKDKGGIGNPGNDKDVGNAGENPNGKGGWGAGDKGMSG